MPRSLASSAPFRLVRAGDDAPAVTLKAILDFGENTDDGRLVQSVKLPLFLIMRMIQRNPESIYEINWRTWEEIIAGIYFKNGFEVILTPRTGDDGRDIIAIKKGIGCIKFIDQIKAYRPGHLVTADEVRSFIGAIDLERNVSKGIITTTSEFAPGVRDNKKIKTLIPFRLELKARDELLTWLGSLPDT